MSSEAGEAPPAGQGRTEPHVSFVQRLQRHFGSGVDPRINLQDEDPSTTAARPPGTPSSVEDLVKRLAPSLDLGTRYSIKNEVGSGGMGTILRVWDEDLRRNLAMKVMHGRGVGSSTADGTPGSKEVDPERLGRFLEEAQITGQLDHPGVVPVHDLGIDSRGRCFFTMRFVRGADLKEVLDHARAGREGWTRTKVLGVMLKVCEAMAYAHSKGVVHRDLKPANVMVGRFGETYVMDWGLARVLGRRDSHDLRLKPQPGDASALSLVRTVRRDESDKNPDSPLVTMDGDVIGTPSYMAPEQAQGKLEEVGPRSDVYSLGAILYYMLTGEVPYVKAGERVSPHTVLARVLEGPPVAVEKFAPDEPAELVAICVKAMQRDPERRYGSMLEVADDIQAFLENRVVRAYERGSVAEFRKWVARNRGMAAGIAGMVTLSIVSALAFAWQRQREYDSLSIKESETRLAKEAAEKNEELARESEKRARESADLANQQREEADRQALLAGRNQDRAELSAYGANILAADYSLKLNDLSEARARLAQTRDKLRGWEWKHLQLQANAEVAKLGNYQGIEAVAFHPRENRAILLTGQGKVKLIDLVTLHEVPPDTIQVTGDRLVSSLRRLFSNLAMDVDADGTRVALVGESSNVQVFDLETGQRPPGVESGGLPGHESTTSAVSFSPSGRYLASGDVDGAILVRDAQTWEIQQRFTGHIGQVTGFSWSPDSERVASSSRDGSLRVWDLAAGKAQPPMRGHHGPVNAVLWDLFGTQLFSAGDDGSVNLWDVDTGRLLRNFLGHEGAVLALDYDPNHERLVSASADRTVRVWDVATGASSVLRGHQTEVREVAFDPAGDLVISGEQSGTVYLWDSAGDSSTTALDLHRAGINALAFDPEGSRLVTAADDNELVVWDARSGEPLRRLRGHTGPVNAAQFSSDGRTILSGSQDGNACLWDAETGRLLKTYGKFERWIDAVLLTPDGTRVIVASGDKKVRILDAETKQVLHELGGYQYAADAMVLSADGKRLVTLARDILIWDLTGDLRVPTLNLDGRYSALALSPDGLHLACGSQGGTVELRDAATGALLAQQKDQRNRLHSLAFSPDGQRLVSGSDDGEIHVRDAATGDTLLLLEEPLRVEALAFSHDGARIAAGLANGSARIFETSPSGERRAQRREALDLRALARATVDELFTERFYLKDVLSQLETDPDLSGPLRETAVRLAQLRGDDPVPLFQRSLEDCLDSDHADEVYRRALARTAAAETMKDNAAGMPRWELAALSNLALGAASFRAARFADAERYLTKEPELPSTESKLLRREFGKREQALRLLFLCMTQCQNTPGPGAERSWRLAQKSVMNDMELSQRPELLGLLTEVETLVHSSSASSDS